MLIVGTFFIYLFASQGILMEKIPWDFEAYFYAAKTYFMGGNPYDGKIIHEMTGYKNGLTFFYHPYFLLFLGPLTYFSLEKASFIYLAFNAAIILYLIVIFQRWFDRDLKIYLFLFLFFGAFNSALFITFNSGNVSLIEATILWTAFYYLVKERPMAFTVLIFTAALFKIFPIIYLLMLLFIPKVKRKHVGKVLAFLVAIWAIPFLFRPSLFLQYVNNVINPPVERGIINPCSYSLIVDVIQNLTNRQYFAFYIYLLWVALVICFLLLSLRALNWEKDKKNIIFLSVLSFIIAAPRFKDYSYVLAIPVAYGMILKNIQLIIPPFFSFFGFVHRKKIYFDVYHPFFAMLIFWGVLVFQILIKKGSLWISNASN